MENYKVSLFVDYPLSINNVGQFDVNLSPLARPCSRILLVQGGVYCLPCSGWALGFLPTFCFYVKQREDFFHNGNRTANHSIRKWVPLHHHPVDCGHLILSSIISTLTIPISVCYYSKLCSAIPQHLYVTALAQIILFLGRLEFWRPYL